MRIKMAHLRAQGISFAVFAADATDHSPAGRQKFLAQLAARARRDRLRVDKAALAFEEAGRPTFYGPPDLVRYLVSRGVPRWTHSLDV